MLENRRAWSGRMFIGLVFVLCGALWTLDNLDLVESGAVLRWWPLAIVIFGVLQMVGGFGPRRPLAGSIWTAIGLLLLSESLDLVGFSLWSLWPLWLIFVGGLIMYRSYVGPRPVSGRGVTGMSPTEPSATGGSAPVTDDDDVLSCFAVWAGVQRRSTSRAFRGGDATAIMGGIELDLRDAVPVPEGAVLELTAVMGGVDVTVPHDWKIINEVSAIMGGIEDNRSGHGRSPDRILYLRGFAMMGGIEIKDSLKGAKSDDDDEDEPRARRTSGFYGAKAGGVTAGAIVQEKREKDA